MNKNYIIVIVVLVVALGGGFFAGMQYQKSQHPSFAGANGQNGVTGFRGRFGNNPGGSNNQVFRPVRGQVLSLSDTGMTVKMMDGSSRIIVVSGSTTYMKSDTAVKSDVKVGDTVMVLGMQNSDGSVTAQNVAINPQDMRATPSPTAVQ